MLDTCYTGKAFAGLMRRAREGFYKPDDNVLFVHTGGAGGLFTGLGSGRIKENSLSFVPFCNILSSNHSMQVRSVSILWQDH